jgi:hypothetical protein
MSWSVSVTQRAAEALVEIDRQFMELPKFEGPEEEIKKLAHKMVVTALAAYPPGVAVRVVAYGTQSDPDWGKEVKSGHRVNIVKVEIEQDPEFNG